MYTDPWVSESLKNFAPDSIAVETVFSMSAADCDDSKLISRGLLMIPMRMSTWQDYDSCGCPLRDVLFRRNTGGDVRCSR
jgi:hypothetical protein